eukprot:scaffold401362_cov47-Prasinocladus_malaysianus.AAC.1
MVMLLLGDHNAGVQSLSGRMAADKACHLLEAGGFRALIGLERPPPPAYNHQRPGNDPTDSEDTKYDQRGRRAGGHRPAGELFSNL